jgi:putative (di)nucleoside polyphosphate hydrolase
MIRYRPNVAFILRRADGCILIGERSDLPGAWQFPQGGVADGETPDEALQREVLEEISLAPGDYRVVGRRGPYRYEFPEGRTKEGFGGQEQLYFLADFLGDEAQILSQPSTVEFSDVRWIAPAQFRLEWVAPMKRGVYRDVLRDFFDVISKSSGESP